MITRVRRWCPDCQDYTYSVVIDGYELCEYWERADHPDDDDDDDW